MLQTYTIPNLSQGVSQQPDAQRDPTQGEIQVNGVSSISEGLRKRDSTRTIAKVSNSSFGDAYIHTILRDTTEEYLAVITSSGIKVFDLEGTEFTVNDRCNGWIQLSEWHHGCADAAAGADDCGLHVHHQSHHAGEDGHGDSAANA